MKTKTLFAIAATLTCFVMLVSCENENETQISSVGSNESHHAGKDCMSCHKEGGSGSGWFTVAGTVYDETKSVPNPNTKTKLYTGQNGTGTLKYTLETDAKGNFYTTEPVNFGTGLYVSVEGITLSKHMASPVTNGQCNSCHGVSTEKIWSK